MIEIKGFRIFCALLLATTHAIAQPDSLWSRIFEGSREDNCYSVQPTSDGGYLLAGSTRSFGAGLSDFWLIKTDSNGDSLWSQTYGGSSWDICWSVQRTSDDSYILAGQTQSSGAGLDDFWLIKTDSSGDVLWSQTYGGSSWDKCYSAQQASDGGYILAGHTESFGAGEYDFWLVKTDETGDSLWSRTFGGIFVDEYCYSAQQTSDGGYILAGCKASAAWLVKTNAVGDCLWSRTFYDVTLCRCVRQAADGGYILAGYAPHSLGSDNYDFWVLKTDLDGHEIWEKTFGGNADDQCYSFIEILNEGFVLAGMTDSYGMGNGDFWLLRLDENGDSLWSCTFGGDETE